MIPAATATSTLSSCWGVKVECLKDEKEVVVVVVLLEAHWAPQKKKKKKKKKNNASCNGGESGLLCRVGEAKLIYITCTSRNVPKRCLL